MKSKALALVGLLGILVVGCGGAPDAPGTNDGYEVTTDEAAKVGESGQALTIGSNLGTGATTSIQACVDKQFCEWQCTEPVNKDDIYHCKLVCQTVCVPL